MTAVTVERTRILIVARPAFGRMIQDVLTAAGHEAHRTPEGARAAEAVSRLRPGIVLVALDLPWFDGIEAIRALRGLYPTLPVLALGEATSVPAASGLKVIPIAIDGSRLLHSVADLLANSRPVRGRFGQVGDRLIQEPQIAPRTGRCARPAP